MAPRRGSLSSVHCVECTSYEVDAALGLTAHVGRVGRLHVEIDAVNSLPGIGIDRDALARRQCALVIRIRLGHGNDRGCSIGGGDRRVQRLGPIVGRPPVLGQLHHCITRAGRSKFRVLGQCLRDGTMQPRALARQQRVVGRLSQECVTEPEGILVLARHQDLLLDCLGDRRVEFVGADLRGRGQQSVVDRRARRGRDPDDVRCLRRQALDPHHDDVPQRPSGEPWRAARPPVPRRRRGCHPNESRRRRQGSSREHHRRCR